MGENGGDDDDSWRWGGNCNGNSINDGTKTQNDLDQGDPPKMVEILQLFNQFLC